MDDGYKVERRRLERHAAWLDQRRGEWTGAIPNELYRLHTSGAEFPTVGADLARTLEGLRIRYADEIVPGISNLMGEVVASLHSVEKTYGDAEQASIVANEGDRFPGPGDDLAQGLS